MSEHWVVIVLILAMAAMPIVGLITSNGDEVRRMEVCLEAKKANIELRGCD